MSSVPHMPNFTNDYSTKSKIELCNIENLSETSLQCKNQLIITIKYEVFFHLPEKGVPQN